MAPTVLDSSSPRALLAALPRPWQFASSYRRRRLLGAFLLRICAVLISLGGAFWLQGEWRQIAHDVALAADPNTVEVPADFEGRVETRFGLLASYRGTVRYDLPDGRTHQAKVDFDTWTEVDNRIPVAVRFRPDAPTDFVFSWAASTSGERWGMFGLFAVVVLGFVAMPWWSARKFAQQARLLAALANDGEGRLGRLVQVQDVKPYGRVVNRIHTVEVQVGERVQRVNQAFPPRRGGAFRIGDEHVLLLASPSFPRDVLVLREDLWPLQVDAATLAKVRSMALSHAPTDVAPADLHA